MRSGRIVGVRPGRASGRSSPAAYGCGVGLRSQMPHTSFRTANSPPAAKRTPVGLSRATREPPHPSRGQRSPSHQPRRLISFTMPHRNPLNGRITESPRRTTARGAHGCHRSTDSCAQGPHPPGQSHGRVGFAGQRRAVPTCPRPRASDQSLHSMPRRLQSIGGHPPARPGPRLVTPPTPAKRCRPVGS